MSVVDVVCLSLYVLAMVGCVFPPAWLQTVWGRVRLFVELSIESYRIR